MSDEARKWAERMQHYFDDDEAPYSHICRLLAANELLKNIIMGKYPEGGWAKALNVQTKIKRLLAENERLRRIIDTCRYCRQEAKNAK